MKQYDIIIIGGGPAGSTLARFAHDKKIAIFDARPLNHDYKIGDRIKSCGGLLSPRTQKFLKQNNITVQKDILDDEQYNHVKTIDFDTKLTRHYKRNYINVDREKFDRFLLNDIVADKFFDTPVYKIEKQNNLFIINDEFVAPILVGADGASSIVRRTFFPNTNFKTYVSIQEVFDKKLINEYECYFDKNTSDYYGWALNKNRCTYFGYLIPAGANAREKFDAFKFKRGFKNNISTEGAMLIRPTFFHPVLVKENLFLIGEAGGWVTPSGAEGISFAMRTAKILADTDFDIKRFKRKMLKIRAHIFYANLKSIAMHTPWIRAIIMRLSFGK